MLSSELLIGILTIVVPVRTRVFCDVLLLQAKLFARIVAALVMIWFLKSDRCLFDVYRGWGHVYLRYANFSCLRSALVSSHGVQHVILLVLMTNPWYDNTFPLLLNIT